MNEKKCSRCNLVFSLSMYSPDKKAKDKKKSYCNFCGIEYSRNYSKTARGHLTSVFNHQKQKSLKRWGDVPKYSAEEFRQKYEFDKEYLKLYNDWKNSGYLKNLSPSFDRYDDSIGYSFDNLNRWMTWKENSVKANLDIRSGKLIHGNKPQKMIFQILNNQIIRRFISISEAGRETGISRKNICTVCSGKRAKAGGFNWSFPENVNPEILTKYEILIEHEL